MAVNSVIKHSVMPKDMFQAKMWKPEEVFIGDSAYHIVISPASKKNGAVQFHMAAMKDGEVQTFKDLNNTLYDITATKYIDELNERLCDALQNQIKWTHTGNHDIYVSYGDMKQWEEGTSAKETAIRIILMVKNVENMTPEEEKLLRKILKGELVEWMDSVIRDKPAIERTKQDYENDLVKVMDTSMLPHTKSSFNPIPLITVIGLAFAILGVFYAKYELFQVCAVVLSGYAGFRAYQRGQKEYMFVNVAVCLISVFFIYYGYVNA